MSLAIDQLKAEDQARRQAYREQTGKESREASRLLALEIGSALTTASDRTDPDAVLACTGPVQDWLTGGPDDNGDRRNRRRAARQHLSNLCATAEAVCRTRQQGIPGVFTWPDPESFVTVADRYYMMLAGG
jgi:hypothetical protein